MFRLHPSKMSRIVVQSLVAIIVVVASARSTSVFAAQVRLYDVECAKVRVAGVTTASAPFVRVTVATASNLTNTLATKLQGILPVVGRSFDITLEFAEQPASTRLIISVGEWDGRKYANPAVLYGQDCISKPPVPPAAIPDTQFQSEALRFSIKYPTKWTTEMLDNAVNFTSNEQYGSKIEPIVYTVSADEVVNSKGLPFETLVTQNLPTELTSTFAYTQRSFGDYVAYITESLPSRSGMLTAFLTRDGKRYLRVELAPYYPENPFPKQAEYKSLFEAMLATFRME